MARVAIYFIDTVRLDAFAGVVLTWIHTLRAVEPGEVIWAVAGEINTPKIAGTVSARCLDTGIIQLFTLFTHVPHWSTCAQAHIVILELNTCIIKAGR